MKSPKHSSALIFRFGLTSRMGSALAALSLAACTGNIAGGGSTNGGGNASGNSTGSTSSGGARGSGTGGVKAAGGSGGNQIGGGSGATTGQGGSGGITISTGSGGSGGGTVAACDGLTSRRVRRLSIREYSNVVNDLLGATAKTESLAALPAEPTVGGFDNQNTALFVSSDMQGNLADLAAQLASEANPTTLAPCATTGGSAACLQTFINSFGTKAYGRPLTTAEVAAATTLAGMGQDYATSVRLIVEMMLQSPSMVYISELGADTAAPSAQPVPLTPYEIASQLSFVLTGTRPDSTLLTAAQSGFANPSDIQAQVQRLMPTAAAQSQLALFIKGWLNIGPMSDISKSPDVYPEYTPALATAMQQELDQFITAQLNNGNGTLSGFMTATSANVPPALKPIYGADLLASGPNPTHRKGILSLPAVLTYNSSDISSGPIQRGLLVRRTLLCQDVPPPPADVLQQVALMPVDTTDTTMTTRQKFEAHLNMPSCSACHTLFDPIGFGLEDMDGLGRFRTTENGMPVDSSGTLTVPSESSISGAFEGPADLSSKLAQSTTLAGCMVSHFFNFAQSRDPGPTDQCVVQDWTNSFVQGGGRITDLVNNYVVHQDFAFRKDDRL